MVFLDAVEYPSKQMGKIRPFGDQQETKHDRQIMDGSFTDIKSNETGRYTS